MPAQHMVAFSCTTPTRMAPTACRCLVQELVQQERSLLEAALASPSAAHPTEGFGSEGLSLAQTRRRIAQCIQ